MRVLSCFYLSLKGGQCDFASNLVNSIEVLAFDFATYLDHHTNVSILLIEGLLTLLFQLTMLSQIGCLRKSPTTNVKVYIIILISLLYLSFSLELTTSQNLKYYG